MKLLNLAPRLAVMLLAVGVCAGTAAAADNATIRNFTKTLSPMPVPDPHVNEQINAAAERFFVWTPAEFKDDGTWGLVVFIDAGDDLHELPAGWTSVLKKRKLLFVAPQNAGNNVTTDRRTGLALVAAREMLLEHQLDAKRVFAAGYSGGARSASQLGLFEPTVFHGTIQCCGSDFYAPVPHTTPRAESDKADDTDAYGVIQQTTPDEVSAAKAQTAFAIVTGSGDFRHASLLDEFHGGYEKEGFHARLFDVPDMGHDTCSGKVLSAVLDFIDPSSASAVPATGPTDKPAPWAASDPAKWPPILAYNDGVLTGNQGIGGSAFLLRLPNNAVVAATALHVFGNGVTIGQLDGMIKSWALISPALPTRKLVVKKLAMKAPTSGEPLDAVLANVAQARQYPFEVLTPRSTPVEEGDTVYVLGNTRGEHATQGVYKATVVSIPNGPGDLQYEFIPEIDTMGFSGAPVLDSNGHVVAIHGGHGEFAAKHFGYGIGIDSAIRQADAPPGLPEIKLTASATAAGNHEPTTKPGNADNAAAASALSMANLYIANGKADLGRAKLEAIIKTYPGTPEAAKARQSLDGLDAK